MLHVHLSNKLENLAKKLAALLKKRKGPVFSPSVILIQSRGMEKWISMKIAEENGICANVRFLFPNTLINEVFRSVLEDISQEPFLDVEFMKWKLMTIIPSFIQKRSFSFLSRYISEEKRDISLFQFCSLIADTFDQYIVFRPDMISRWERGLDEHWQACLFRDLIKNTNNYHRSKLAMLFKEKLFEKRAILPSVIYVFGISAIPRFHLDILYSLAQVIDVHLFLMNPCKEYWGDLVPEKYILRKGESAKEKLYLEVGNPLLSSLGKLGRDFFDIINEYESVTHENFKDIQEKNLLTHIQSDILNMRDPSTIPKREIKEDDLSIQIHSCYSPMIEVEVLYHNILHMLDADPSLSPKDLLVMTPDIEKYAPFIQAVFGAPDPDAKIPFSIADRSPKWERKLIRAFFKILELRNTRLEASKVLDVLESELIAKRFGINSEELDTIRTWINESGIRWGIDRQHRKEWIDSITDIGTWKKGLESLLLGYALLDENEGVFDGIFPYEYVEGKSELLGRLIDFLTRLFEYVKEFSKKKTMKQWQELFFNLLDELFLIDEESYRDAHLLREIISEMVEYSENASFYEPVSIEVPVWNMEKILGRKGYGSRFLTGGITFCAMLPMRSIPFRVICLIGMNYDGFPRYSKSWEFDLIQKYPRKGDRSKRDDDRYLFLEAIISAREKLYISYTGRSIKDSSPIPPSVVVSELIDYIEQGFYIKDKNIVEHISFEHPLHPFNPIYFKEGRFFNYSEKDFKSAKNMLSERISPTPFLKRLSLAQMDDELEIDDLCQFFSNPVRFLLRKKLNLVLERDTEFLEDEEVFKLRGLQKYRFEQQLLEYRLNRQRMQIKEFFQHRGLLPLGALGEYEFLKVSQKMRLFLDRIGPYLEKEKKEFELEARIRGLLVKAKVKDIYGDELFMFRFSRIRASDRIKFWLYYLFCLINGLHLSGGVFIGFDKNERPISLRLSPLRKDEAESYFSEMLDIYKKGHKRAIHFFPESGWKYAEALFVKKEDQEKAIQRARFQWEGSDYAMGEGKNEYYEFCFKGNDPIDEEFFELSKKMFLPIILNTKRQD